MLFKVTKYLRLIETTLWTVLKTYFGESTRFNKEIILFQITIEIWHGLMAVRLIIIGLDLIKVVPGALREFGNNWYQILIIFFHDWYTDRR